MKQHVNLLKISYSLTELLIGLPNFLQIYTFYGVFYFVYSGLSSVIFSPLPIIYCILLFLCHFFSNKPVQTRVQFLVVSNFFFLFSSTVRFFSPPPPSPLQINKIFNFPLFAV